MSLLDTASLIVTPNGYKEGKLYSVIPSDGSGDLSVTRATTATRVNSAGLVELVPYNLFTYSEQFDNADWSKSSGTITADATTAPNGTTTADLFTANGVLGVHDFFQGFTGGSQTTASIYVKKNTAQYVYISLNYQGTGSDWATGIYNLDALTTATFQSGGVNNQIAIISDAGNGWRRITLKVDTANTALFCMYGVADSMSPTFSSRGRVENSSSASFYAWGAQVVEGSVAKDYQKTETRINIPRLDYSNGTCPSILVEPQRTNLLLQSSSFSSLGWQNCCGASITSNSTISPSGIQDADTYGTSQSAQLWQTVVASTNTTYTLSMWVKLGTATNLCLVANNTAAWNTIGGQSFDSSNGLNTSTWTRISWTFNTPSILPAGAINIHLGGNAQTGLTQSTGTVYIWGAQLESGSYATSYIPTTSASVTRNADVISKTGISSLIGQTEGTLFWDVQKQLGENDVRLNISDGTTNNWLFVGVEFSNYTRIYCNVGGVNQMNIYGAQLSNDFHKIAFAYKANDFVLYVDGVQVASHTSGSVPNCSRIDINAAYPTSGAFATNNNKAVALWKTRLTNTQLAQLTTI